jgi:ubiquitin carboxyl-terminal hydrolase 9/24
MFHSSDYLLYGYGQHSELPIFLQASRYIPDICVIRAIQKIIWAAGCGSLELVFSPNEDITETYKMVRITEIMFFK